MDSIRAGDHKSRESQKVRISQRGVCLVDFTLGFGAESLTT